MDFITNATSTVNSGSDDDPNIMNCDICCQNIDICEHNETQFDNICDDSMTLDEVKVLEIHNKLERIFETIGHIYNNITDKNKQWYENVRIFIKYHIDILDEIDGEEEETDEDNIIKQKGFEYFVGEKCADIDEDEFDGPNDLSREEWWDIDYIILYYYNKL